MNRGPRKFILSKVDFTDLGVFLFLIIFIFRPVIINVIQAGYDYDAHIELAERMAATHRLESPHFFFQLLLIIFHIIIPGISYETSAAIILILVQITLGLTIVFTLREHIPPPVSPTYTFIFPLTALALMIMTPITLPTIPENNFYHGYLYNSNVYHNPTIILIKPLSLLLFLQALKVFQSSKRKSSWAMTISTGVLVIVSSISKPNYLICFLPALAVLIVVCLPIRKRPGDMKLFFCGILAPAVVVLSWQYFVTFSFNHITADPSRIEFQPLLVFSHFSSHLLVKFILSILFPLAVLVLYRENSFRDISIGLSWLVFLFGAAYTYFLAEGGTRAWCGNFAWSGQIASFVLFVSSAIFVFRTELAFPQRSLPFWKSPRFLTVVLIFSLHLISGMLWYYKHLTHSHYQNFW